VAIERFDVVVIGVGAMGSAACSSLARRGAGVLGLERFEIPHSFGAHHGHSRLIRLAYYEHPDYVPLLHRAYELWEDLERRCCIRLLYRVGGLYLGHAEDPFVAGSIQSAREYSLAHEVLSRGQIAQAYPQFHLPDSFIGMYEPTSGVLRAASAVRALAEDARTHGAQLRSNEHVLDITGRRVITNRGEYHARHVILTQGAWAHDVGVELTVTRQVLGWVRPIRPERFSSEVFPCFAISCSDGSAHYGFPLIDGVPPPGLFKIAHHWYDRPTTPDRVNREPEPGDEADFRGALSRYLPEADGPLAQIGICLYTSTPDRHFIIDHHPHDPNTTVACGFSGHGFKFAPVVGEILADLALDGQTDYPIEFLSLQRFIRPNGH